MTARTFACCGVGLQVIASAPRDAARLQRLIRRLFLVGAPPTGKPPAVIDLTGTPGWTAPAGAPSFRSGPLDAYLLDTGYEIRCGGSHLHVDPERGRSTGHLHPDFWTLSPPYQRAFLFLPFLAHLSAHGLFAIHANGLVHQRTGYLIAADSHGGKTTLTLSLLRAGWRYVSDDTVLLRESAGGVEALGFRRGFACDGATLRRFPELDRAGAPHAWKDGKLLFDVAPVYPRRRSPLCRPRILLFPSIRHAPETILEPLPPSEAMGRLLRHSPLVRLSPAAAGPHLRALSGLLRQSACFRLSAGTDVFTNAEAVARLLAAAEPSHAYAGG